MILIGPAWVLLESHGVRKRQFLCGKRNIESKHAYENDLTFLELKASYQLSRDKWTIFLTV